MIIKLVRHGQSQANVQEVDSTRTGDHNTELTTTGIRQAKLAGRFLIEKTKFVDEDGILLYASPYARTRQTLNEMLGPYGWGPYGHPYPPQPLYYEDPRLREVEWGYDKPKDHGDYVDDMRETHGKFYYRIAGGESPADCYDRVSTFLETMMRQIKRKKANKILIVSHGLTIRCFVMRFMHLTVEQFDDIWNPKNCDIITISNQPELVRPTGPGFSSIIHKAQFTCGNWIAYGLRLPKSGQPGSRVFPWSCPMCKSDGVVWPHPEFNIEDSHCNMCEKCGEKLYSAHPYP